MSQIEKRGIESNAIDGTKTRFSNNESFRVRNFANLADISLFKVTASDVWEFQVLPKFGASNIATESFVTTELANYIPSSQKGAASGVAPLNASSQIDSSYLPSYVDDVLEYANLASFPVTGETGKIYIDIATSKVYRWSGSVYVYITSGAVDSVNSQTGVVVLNTSHIAENTNLYYTQSRFDTAFSAKSTTNLSEGSNLYHTTTRARTAAVVNSTAGSETDQAASVSAMKLYVNAQSANVAGESFVLTGTDVTNGYIDLAVTADVVISLVPKGFPPQHPVDDFTLSVVSLKTRITFAGTMLSLISGDKIRVSYSV